MRKLLCIALCAICLMTNAQDLDKWNMRPVQSVEGGIYLGASIPFRVLPGCQRDGSGGGLCLGTELRYNIHSVPLDFGAQVGYFCNNFEYHSFNPVLNVCQDMTVSWDAIKFVALADWNFRQGRKVNLFVGLGLGYVCGGSHCNYGDEPGKDVSGLIGTPRIGVELFYNLRITVAANLYKSAPGYNDIELTIGAHFGGRPRR